MTFGNIKPPTNCVYHRAGKAASLGLHHRDHRFGATAHERHSSRSRGWVSLGSAVWCSWDQLDGRCGFVEKNHGTIFFKTKAWGCLKRYEIIIYME